MVPFPFMYGTTPARGDPGALTSPAGPNPPGAGSGWLCGLPGSALDAGDPHPDDPDAHDSCVDGKKKNAENAGAGAGVSGGFRGGGSRRGPSPRCAARPRPSEGGVGGGRGGGTRRPIVSPATGGGRRGGGPGGGGAEWGRTFSLRYCPVSS